MFLHCEIHRREKMIPKVSRSDVESVSRGFPTAFGAESEFRDVVGCCYYYGVCGEGARIPIGDQMQFVEVVIKVKDETFAKQLQAQQPCWPNCDPSLNNAAAATFYWLH